VDLADLLGPVGEVGDIGGQQPRDPPPGRRQRDRAGTRFRRVQARVAGDDVVLEPLQRRTGLQAQLVDHHPPGLLVDRERLGGPAAAVQGEHQLAAQALAQRIPPGQLGQLTDQLMMPAQVNFQGQPVFDGGGPLLIEPGRRGPDEQAVDTLEGRPPPQPERVAVARRGLVEVTGAASRPARGDQLLEPAGVQPAGLDLQDVALRLPDYGGRRPVRGQQPTCGTGPPDPAFGPSIRYRPAKARRKHAGGAWGQRSPKERSDDADD